MTLEDSATYQMVIQKGRTREAQAIVLRLGRTKFGTPNAQVEATVRGITDVERLEQLADRMLFAASWEELLATP